MKKIEQVYREVLFQLVENRKKKLTQAEIALNLGLSLSTVNAAARKLSEIGAIIIEQRGFRVVDIGKIFYFWASLRNLNKDIIYSIRVEMPVREIERNLPNIFYSCFSGYKFKFKDVPADYSEVYVYADEDDLNEIKKRFPENNKNPNLFVLKADENMGKYGKSLTIGQIFVDLWNLKTWYAKYFLDELEKRINFREQK